MRQLKMDFMSAITSMEVRFISAEQPTIVQRHSNETSFFH
jgi:hypothetical protein